MARSSRRKSRDWERDTEDGIVFLYDEKELLLIQENQERAGG